MKKAIYNVIRVFSGNSSLTNIEILEEALNEGWTIERVDFLPETDETLPSNDYILFKWVDEEDNSYHDTRKD